MCAAVPSVRVKVQLLDAFARRHHGLINARAAAALGVSRSSWQRAIASDAFEPLYPNVARLWGSPETFQQRALAAVWAAGADALGSHRTSAALWGVQRPADDPIDVMLCSRSRHSLPADVVIHRPRDLRDLRPILLHQIPTTNPIRMLVDLGAVDPDGVQPALIAVMSSKVASPAAIRAGLLRHAKRGRHGISALRVALETWQDQELAPDSALEAAMAALVQTHRLPALQFHAVVLGYEVDFLVVGTRLIIECDGWESHGLDRNQFEFDRIRNSELVGAGYVIVHITWRQLRSAPAEVAQRIRQVVQQWAPHLANWG